MPTIAYVTSSATSQMLFGESGALADLEADIRAARALKKRIAALEAERQALHAQLPALLFGEAGALLDLEQDIEAEATAWEAAKLKWLADACANPAYAVKSARYIVSAQAKYEQSLRLQTTWQELAQEGSRSLATFRKAYDRVARSRHNEMMSNLTGGQSTCAFHNAVERQQGCALAEYAQYDDRICSRLARYERDAEKMTRVG